MKTLLIVLAIVLVLGVVAVDQRHYLLYQSMRLGGGAPPALLDAGQELSSTVWFDDYYTIDRLAPDTYAIGEPRYAQQNINYLIVGTERALLFDAGPGVRDITPVVESLTTLPVVFLPSHFHYDHVGNGVEFAQRAVVDLPYLRDRAEGNQLAFTDMEHLGPVEGFAVPTWRVDHWWAPGMPISLGGREVTIVHTPGHSPESISLYDVANNAIYAGDYLYEGPLYAFVPGASVQDYLTTAQKLLKTYAQTEVYYGAHRMGPPGPPTLSRQDVVDLERTLLAMRAGSLTGSGTWPVSFVVNDRITLLADPALLQDWD